MNQLLTRVSDFLFKHRKSDKSRGLTMIIKAIVSTTPGIMRLLLQDDSSGTKVLFKEIPVPAQTKSGKMVAFEYTIDFADDFELQKNYNLYASTEKDESFKLINVGLVRAYAA